MTSITVLGAGPTGLMAAQRLARSGHDVTVIEAADAIGGMAGSFEVAGQRVDFGSHRLHPSTPPALLDELRSLLGGELQERQRNGRINLLGQWIAFPLRTGDLIRELPRSFAVGAARDSLLSPLRSRDERSFLSAIESGLGPTVASEFYAPYARKLYGVDPDALSAEVARRRVSASSPLAIVKRLLAARKGSGRTFLYPKHGYGSIVERIGEAAVEAGADVQCGSPVTALSSTDDGVEITAGGTVHRSERVVSTIPLPRLASALGDAVPADVRSALGRLRTRGMLLVYLVVPRPEYTRFDAHYLPGLDQRTARLSEPKNYRDGPDPAGQTVLCAEIPCWATDDIWGWSDADLGELVSDELVALGLPAPGHVEVVTRRLASVYPVYERATMADRNRVTEWSGELGPILATGRQGHDVFDNLHHVLQMGEAVDHAMIDGRFDQAVWASSLRRFGEFVVED